ncbi:DUF2490 domain-containing protein [Hymenobacter artigasi]|uniref:DUF2490 domain-containing protein n=1 Tax=Hymenobacter artigasi TaxID=2719616 RepID=A0ABX1HHF1_9BACT|nr:DUF2490 domain-containing protein [Hymenobacter artigasi]NKI88492.1 hypothetical protein [Hymenobacter artigasi]
MKRLLLPLLLFPCLAPAQTVRQAGYWGRLYLRTHFGPRLTLHSEADERRFAWPDGQWQFITHQHLHYRLSPTWDAALGGTGSWQPQKGISVPERRVFEEVTATLPLPGRLRLMPRLRVEQRWLGHLAGPETADTWQYRLRYRGRLQLDYQINTTWKFRASDELLLNPDSFDQNRLYAGAERQLGAGFAAELGYLFIWQQRPANAGYYARDVLRLTLFKDLILPTARAN